MSDEAVDLGELIIEQVSCGFMANEYVVFFNYDGDGPKRIANVVTVAGGPDVVLFPKVGASLSLSELVELEGRFAALNEWPKASLVVRRID